MHVPCYEGHDTVHKVVLFDVGGGAPRTRGMTLGTTTLYGVKQLPDRDSQVARQHEFTTP